MSSPVPKRAVWGAGTDSSATSVRRKRARSGAGSRASSRASRSSTASTASYACRSGAGHEPRWATLPSRLPSSCRAQRDQCCQVSGEGSGAQQLGDVLQEAGKVTGVGRLPGEALDAPALVERQLLAAAVELVGQRGQAAQPAARGRA